MEQDRFWSVPTSQGLNCDLGTEYECRPVWVEGEQYEEPDQFDTGIEGDELRAGASGESGILTLPFSKRQPNDGNMFSSSSTTRVVLPSCGRTLTLVFFKFSSFLSKLLRSMYTVGASLRKRLEEVVESWLLDSVLGDLEASFTLR
ncbi:hypothetical protein PIB30_025356 [Stylosanthes scabra]|uniref:Uncharacterized protein n=1 Tax=Stylosanthes scabra TaxID=79078 RepID=A0ABU6Y919_9FABA|nr:hypothetical protein [Stylosanthes scabra]